MIAYEFSTEVTDHRTLLIPENYAQILPTGASVRVILLVKENSSMNGYRDAPTIELPSLEEIVAEIKQLPPNPNNVRPGSGLLGKHLVELEKEYDPTFDSNAWLREWDQLEADMKSESLAHEARNLAEMSK